MRAPFPYFGGKSMIAHEIWARFGTPRQYVEPFLGSAAVLLAAPRPASLEVVGDANGFVANFWRATVHQAAAVARWADYPVSHVDLGARHLWLMRQRAALGEALQDPDWPGNAKVAGWWLWGQCSWIGSGWCDWWRTSEMRGALGQVPHISDAGMGVQALGKVPHISDAGRGVQALGQVPHISDAGRGDEMWTSSGRTALRWLRKLAGRLERVRVVHGEWDRCLNHHYGGDATAVFLDPPYDGFDAPYGSTPVAQAVAEWAREHEHLRVCLAGHAGDYEMPKWEALAWSRKGNTYSGNGTKDAEMLWFSPACEAGNGQGVLL